MNSLSAIVKMKADKSIDASVSMYRLFMKDCQMKDKNTSLLFEEFQYLICNPKLELEGDKVVSEELGQLKVAFVANDKENEQNITTTLADFRINLAFPTVKAILIFSQKLQGFSHNVMIKLGELQKVSAREEISIEKEVPKAIKPEEKPTKGKMNVNVKLANLEVIIPTDPTKQKTEVIKFAVSTDVNFINAVDAEGIIDRLIYTNVTSLSIICSQEERVESILNKMSILAKYKEKVGVDRDIFVDIKPIMIKVTFKELQFIQYLADNITKELEMLQPKVEEEKKEEAKVKVEGKVEQKVEEIKEIVQEEDKSDKKELSPKLKVVVNMSLLKFVLEDNLSKYKYPLVKMWVANTAVDTLLDPVNGTKVSAHIFEIAIELGQMFDKDTEKTEYYEEYFKQLPFSNIENEPSETVELYKESM